MEGEIKVEKLKASIECVVSHAVLQAAWDQLYQPRLNLLKQARDQTRHTQYQYGTK